MESYGEVRLEVRALTFLLTSEGFGWGVPGTGTSRSGKANVSQVQ